MEIKITELSELKDVAKKLLATHPNKKIFLFNAEMGAGKTTFIKVLCEELGVKDSISSPTFSIVNEYKGKEGTIYHFDCYRLDDEAEGLDIGIEDYLFSDNICFIEWPDIIENFLPEEDKCVRINIFVTDGDRIFQF